MEAFNTISIAKVSREIFLITITLFFCSSTLLFSPLPYFVFFLITYCCLFFYYFRSFFALFVRNTQLFSHDKYLIHLFIYFRIFKRQCVLLWEHGRRTWRGGRQQATSIHEYSLSRFSMENYWEKISYIFNMNLGAELMELQEIYNEQKWLLCCLTTMFMT